MQTIYSKKLSEQINVNGLSNKEIEALALACSLSPGDWEIKNEADNYQDVDFFDDWHTFIPVPRLEGLQVIGCSLRIANKAQEYFVHDVCFDKQEGRIYFHQGDYYGNLLAALTRLTERVGKYVNPEKSHKKNRKNKYLICYQVNAEAEILAASKSDAIKLLEDNLCLEVQHEACVYETFEYDNLTYIDIQEE